MVNTLKDGLEIPASVPVMIKALESAFAEQRKRNGKRDDAVIELAQHDVRVSKDRTRGTRLCLVVQNVVATALADGELHVEDQGDSRWWNVILRFTRHESGLRTFQPLLVEENFEGVWSEKTHHLVSTFVFGAAGTIVKVKDTHPT